MRTLLDEVVIGKRTVNGTDFPVSYQLHQDKMPGRRPTWVVTRAVCNGAADGATDYKTRREAVAAFGKYKSR